MQRLSNSGVLGFLALCVGLAGAACGPEATPAGGSASSSAKPAASGSAAASAKKDAAKPDAKKPDDKKAGVNVKDIIKADPKDTNKTLKVDLSKAEKTAPPLAGVDPTPPAAAAGSELSWIPVGGVSIPNPGWKKSATGELGMLQSPDDKAGVLFTKFKSGDGDEGVKKVDEIVAAMKFKDVVWAEPDPALIGLNGDLPALIGAGHAVDEAGKPTTLFWAMVHTGDPEDLLAVGGWDDDSPEALSTTTIEIVTSIKSGAADAAPDASGAPSAGPAPKADDPD